MGWIYLLLAGCCEIFYAAAIPRTDGFTRLWPGVFCAVFICLSMYLLSLATRTIPVGTAYAVWVGMGRWVWALMASPCWAKTAVRCGFFCFFLILSGITGLKLLTSDER